MAEKTLLRKAVQTIRNEGTGKFFKKAGDYVDHKVEPLKRVFASSAARAIKKLPPENRDVETLVNFLFNNFGGLIRPAQVKSEITGLAKLVKELKPKTVVEIGTAKGGTLFLSSRLADPKAKIISIDLPGGGFGGGYPAWKTKLYKTFSLSSQTMELLRADSHAPATRETLKSILGSTPVDFLFIDGDHTYEGVKKDFELYSPFVRKGGLIAFHDVAVHPAETGCEVHLFWEEVKAMHAATAREFIENVNQKWAGIGVFYVS